MNFVLEGLLFGLTLSILLGPIFITLTQTAIEKGARAGIMVGTGIWISDLIIMSLCLLFVNAITPYFQDSNAKLITGIIGGIFLIALGFASFFAKVDLVAKHKSISFKSFSGFWLKGFLVNTVNPFTFIFWTTTVSQYIIAREVSTRNSIIFLSTILFTIIVTDTLKVILAKMIRKKLKEKHIVFFSRTAGVGLFIFGLILIYKCIP